MFNSAFILTSCFRMLPKYFKGGYLFNLTFIDLQRKIYIYVLYLLYEI